MTSPAGSRPCLGHRQGCRRCRLARCSARRAALCRMAAWRGGDSWPPAPAAGASLPRFPLPGPPTGGWPAARRGPPPHRRLPSALPAPSRPAVSRSARPRPAQGRPQASRRAHAIACGSPAGRSAAAQWRAAAQWARQLRPARLPLPVATKPALPCAGPLRHPPPVPRGHCRLGSTAASQGWPHAAAARQPARLGRVAPARQRPRPPRHPRRGRARTRAKAASHARLVGPRAGLTRHASGTSR
mmetsp:Transcript_9148/g.35787  ORF Transcript_9148/g.35787 Transcript_9148/m.35787 type:complete len:243 (-) Transcript_9148:496-1224(-)